MPTPADSNAPLRRTIADAQALVRVIAVAKVPNPDDLNALYRHCHTLLGSSTRRAETVSLVDALEHLSDQLRFGKIPTNSQTMIGLRGAFAALLAAADDEPEAPQKLRRCELRIRALASPG